MSEENKCEYYEIKNYETAFKCFKQRFLIDRKSIFRLEDDDEILTVKNIDYLTENFINNGYTGNANFIDKIKKQLVLEPADTTHMKGALEILATAIWLWRLPPSNTTWQGRINSVKEILNLDDNLENLSLDENPFFEDIKGFASTGTYYNTNKPTELAYIIKFFAEYTKEENSSIIDIVNILLDDGFSGKMEITTTKDYSKKDSGELILSNFKDKSHDKPRSVSIHNALLHVFDMENYEPILSNNHKKLIIDTFKEYCKEDIADKKIDGKLHCIKNALKNLNKFEKSFYDKNLRQIWQGGFDFESKNIILHGAPGTGKTYLTENTIKNKIDFEGGEYTLVQFHPSYSYEDFIDGIKPSGIDENGQMKFELVNGEFKQMCIDAFFELQINKREAKKFYFIADEVNRAELSRVFGELLLCLEDDKRLKFDKDNNLLGTKVKTQNSKLWKINDAVVVIKNGQVVDINKIDFNLRNNEKELKKEGYEYYFGVPENLYFIGTMNDIDRSVDSFDMALRRRFLWKHYTCDYDVVIEKFESEDEEKVSDYIKICEKLNKHITSEKGFNLGKSYELGHSYFMKPKKLNDVQLNKVWDENIAPLLKEYLRAEYPENKIELKLKEAKKIFTLQEKKQ